MSHLAQYYHIQAAHPTESYPSLEVAEAVFNYAPTSPPCLTGLAPRLKYPNDHRCSMVLQQIKAAISCTAIQRRYLPLSQIYACLYE
ncbi:CFF_HP2_G0027930.mRNA.1.CDS.1 [Saccharomyces cerevisiae]|nr:CFF_HP2_G0027930.mRNA.1.CDS.1 [Saccharomyces cerevisiae]CAI6660034.1 CFF_HP2_G0027930.mRNA.1.CDS.1 [Saccharomyces cerevisiae]